MPEACDALAQARGRLLIMGLYANYPIACAPGMGLNAYFAYTVVEGMGFTWEGQGYSTSSSCSSSSSCSIPPAR